MRNLTSFEKVSLTIACVSCAAALVMVPEIRAALGLDSDKSATTSTQAEQGFSGIETLMPTVEDAPAPVSRIDAVASASSVLEPSRVATYTPDKVLDGDPASVWVEGVAGHGEGEWIRLQFPEARTLERIEILNGYPRGERFAQNGRVRTATLTFSDGSSHALHLQDIGVFQQLDLPPVRTSAVTLVIDDVYPGDTWDDTALAEIRVFGRR